MGFHPCVAGIQIVRIGRMCRHVLAVYRNYDNGSISCCRTFACSVAIPARTLCLACAVRYLLKHPAVTGTMRAFCPSRFDGSIPAAHGVDDILLCTSTHYAFELVHECMRVVSALAHDPHLAAILLNLLGMSGKLGGIAALGACGYFCTRR